jgi:hypothetical protein
LFRPRLTPFYFGVGLGALFLRFFAFLGHDSKPRR